MIKKVGVHCLRSTDAERVLPLVHCQWYDHHIVGMRFAYKEGLGEGQIFPFQSKGPTGYWGGISLGKEGEEENEGKIGLDCTCELLSK